MMVSIFSCVCWPFVFPLWRNVYLDFPPIFPLGVFVVVAVAVELYELFVYFGN